MDTTTIAAIAGSVSAVAGAPGAGIAATALRRNRSDQARRDAAGLHARALFLDDGDGEFDLGSVVLKVSNASSHPYYAVVASIAMKQRHTRYAATADMIPPGSDRYARVTSLDCCDTVGFDSSTMVTTTFIDSQGRGWHRDSGGLLERRRFKRKWKSTARLWDRPHRGMALHRLVDRSLLGEHGVVLGSRGVVDELGWQVDMSRLEPPTAEEEEDRRAAPLRDQHDAPAQQDAP